MSSWLLLARNLLATRPRAIPHVILLTDGRNESESRAALDAALGRCAGRFQCDCRGVGTDWEVAELRSIASTLLGTVDIVPLPQDLEADFRAMTESVMGKAVRDVTLQIWTPRGARLRSLLQTAPTVEDLTGMRVDIDERTGAYRTGAWGTESRDYHLDLEVPGHEVGTEMLVARVRVCLGPEVLAQALVRAVWTEDEDVVTSVDPVVAHSGRDAEFAEAVRTAFDARRAGDDAAATAEFGRAALLAAANGDEMKLELLSGVVDLVDATSGTVQLRTQVDAVDEMLLETRSTRTRRVRVAAQ